MIIQCATACPRTKKLPTIGRPTRQQHLFFRSDPSPTTPPPPSSASLSQYALLQWNRCPTRSGQKSRKAGIKMSLLSFGRNLRHTNILWSYRLLSQFFFFFSCSVRVSANIGCHPTDPSLQVSSLLSRYRFSNALSFFFRLWFTWYIRRPSSLLLLYLLLAQAVASEKSRKQKS